MSTYYGYHCKTCNQTSPYWYNRGQNTLRTIFMHRKFLAKVQDIINDNQNTLWMLRLELDYAGKDPDPITRLKDHTDHDIVLQNEYDQEFSL